MSPSRGTEWQATSLISAQEVNIPQMLAVAFSIYHQGCPASQSTETFPGVQMKILSSNPQGVSKARVLQYATSQSKGEVDRFLDYWRRHGSVMRFSLVEKTEENALFNVSLRSRGSWVTKAVVENNGAFSTPVPVSGGLEDWTILVAEEDKSSLFSQLDSLGVVKIKSVARVGLNQILADRNGTLSDLSPRQFQVLKSAFEWGYFDSPRRVGSREVARRFGVAQSTLLEHLRKAQSKLARRALAGF